MVTTEVGEPDPVEERRRRLGDEHLTTVRERCNARAAVDVHSHVSLAGHRRRAGMQPHPHPDRAALEGSLARIGRGDRAGRGRERDEERVALGVDLDAVVGFERSAQHAPVLRERLGVGVRTDRMEQTRRRLDVGEEERDRAAR